MNIRMYLPSLGVTSLTIIATTRALSTHLKPQTLQLPSLNITLPQLNTTNPRLSTEIWPPAPHKVYFREQDSYLLIQNIVPKEIQHTDFDEGVCDSIQDIVRLRFSKKGTAKDFVNNVRETVGHASFTLWPGKTPGVTRGEVVAVLEQLWFLTSEYGAATLFGKYFPKGVEAAEVGLLVG